MALRNHALDDVIIEKAKEEFMLMGFEKASLRTICAKSGITTGALYTRYKSKDELFESIIKNNLEFDKLQFNNVNKLYLDAKENKDVNSFIKAIQEEEKMYLDFLFQNYDQCVLLICKSEGSIIGDNLIKQSKFKCHETVNFFKEISNKKIDIDAINILMQEQLSYYRLILEGGYTKEKAVSIMNTLDTYIEAGWKAIFLKII